MPERSIIRDLFPGLTAEETGPPASGPRSITRDLFPEMGEAGRPAPPPVSAGSAFGRAALNRYLSNLLGIPGLALQGAKKIGLAPESARMPTPEEIRAGVGAFRTPGPITRLGMPAAPPQPVDFGEALAGEMAQTRQAEAEAPTATAAGGVAGDVLTLLTARAPVKALLRGARAKLPGIPMTAEPGIRRAVQDVFALPKVQRLGRGLARAGETGLEGAVLAALDDGDPWKTAGIAAGGQAIGSAVLTAIPKTKLGLAVDMAAGVIAWQAFKELIPGGKDRILESTEHEVRKLTFFGVLGAGAAALGARRASPEGILAKNLPRFAEAVTAIPRGAILSMLKDFTREHERGSDLSHRVTGKFAEDPSYFGEEAGKRIGRALRTGGISAEVNRLMGDVSFRDQVRALYPADPGEPVGQRTADPSMLPSASPSPIGPSIQR